MTSDQRIQQALQWWFYREFWKLFLESEKIRDDLLQESFTIRRNLDLLTRDNLSLSVTKIQAYIQKIDRFHHSLGQLSDRLCPISIQDSLPLSIECLLEPWSNSHPHLDFQINMPIYWRIEPPEQSWIIIRILEELLILTLPETEILLPIYIHITLKQIHSIGLLSVKISYPDISTLIFYSHLPELEHLYNSFKFLISGKCSYFNKNLMSIWHFYW
ncbi:MAG: hypothetical protein HCA25_05740 [Dolichospermum sp. DET50]|jgi:hypothetical protein|nr:hypothetical protein [Dolichospermum sp. DET66]MBS3031793.1 hypothetical protein [Dolichospermum sp. DET67]MBS3037004.1 hypothetical protein [Dolichospermum sp. DET50]QSX69015.1 MAG: hypothetical protein EZY12_04905 [Dolichospermum sp. DET69]